MCFTFSKNEVGETHEEILLLTHRYLWDYLPVQIGSDYNGIRYKCCIGEITTPTLTHRTIQQREELVTPAEHQLTLPADSHLFIFLFNQWIQFTPRTGPV